MILLSEPQYTCLGPMILTDLPLEDNSFSFIYFFLNQIILC